MMGLPKEEWGSMAQVVLQQPVVANRFFVNNAAPSELATLSKSLLNPNGLTTLPYSSIITFLIGINSYFTKLDARVLPYLAIQRYALWTLPTLLAQKPDTPDIFRSNKEVLRLVNTREKIDHLPVLDINLVGRQLLSQNEPWLCNDSEAAILEGVTGGGARVTRKVIAYDKQGQLTPLALIKDYSKPFILLLEDCQTQDGWFLPAGLLLSSDNEKVTDVLRAVLVASPSIQVDTEQLKERNLKWAPIRSIKPWKSKAVTNGWIVKQPQATLEEYQKLARRMLLEENSCSLS